jgi:hypothetical protein
MKDLSKRTKAEREKDVAYLASLPLKELRKKQDIVSKQKAMAYTEYIKVSNGKLSGNQRLDKVGDNLDLMWADLFEAIDRREFKKPLWKGEKK